MAGLEIREMDPSTEYFVGTCSHVGESGEIDDCGRRRLGWLHAMREKGLRVHVALLDTDPVGFIYSMPIEACPWGPVGRDLTVIPCLWVLEKGRGVGAGRGLVAEVEREAEERKPSGASYAPGESKGVCAEAYFWDFWFMPGGFYEKLGYTVIARRGERALLWKVFDDSAEPPRFFESAYRFEPVPGRVVVDLFWNRLCQTSEIEAQRVREVAAEFGDRVLLNEFPAHEPAVRDRYQLSRGIYVNGEEVFWGYEAPREGIREAIEKALSPSA
jgi:GNAT superfamily N-acetyltransferase